MTTKKTLFGALCLAAVLALASATCDCDVDCPSGLECGGTITASSGTLRSPNFPDVETAVVCEWNIRTPEGTIVVFRADELLITNCADGRLVVRETSIHDKLKTFCGLSDQGKTHASGRNVMNVHFRTTPRGSPGFVASFFSVVADTECGGYLLEESGSFNTLNYPHQYPINSECFWMIMVPEGPIHLTFDDFELEPSDVSGNCTNDYVEIDSPDDPALPLRLCGEDLAAGDLKVSTAAKSLSVHFRSDPIKTFRGFSASYISGPKEATCKMYTGINKVSLFNGSEIYVPESNEKQVLTSNVGSSDACRFNIRTKFNRVQMAGMNFGVSEARNKHAFTLTFKNGYVSLNTPGTKPDKMNATKVAAGEDVSIGGTAVNVNGTRDAGYVVTSLSGCNYRFEYKLIRYGSDPMFAAHLPKGSYVTDGHCGPLPTIA